MRCQRRTTCSTTALFPPLVILWAWIWQALDPDKSCAKALARIHAHRAALNLEPVSNDTGGYVRARKRPPEGFFRRVFEWLGTTLSAKADNELLWHGRHVKVVDGTSVSMPDTLENQKKWPQPKAQKKGCGFPLLSMVAVFSLATGAALGIKTGVWSAHDLALFYYLRGLFKAGDVVLADRGFCSYAELALFKRRGADSVMRLHQARFSGMRRFRMTMIRENRVTWFRPAQRPRGLRRKDFRLLPATLEVRIIKYRFDRAGFRTHEIEVATTLLDSVEYPAEEISALYGRRWEVELDFRHIKETMKMDPLRGKSPEVVRREIYVHMAAYNLVRAAMFDSASGTEVDPVRLSFKGGIQAMLAHADFMSAGGGADCAAMEDSMMRIIGASEVPRRPGRYEPRVRKRRPKSYPLMTRPRAELKAAVAA